MPDHSVMPSPLANVQQLTALSSQLALQLYSLSSSVSLSTSELNDLAGHINTLAGALRLAGSWLQDQSNIPSASAFRDIAQIAGQCRAVFKEIKAIAPVNELPQPSAGGLDLTVEGSWNWDSLPRAKLVYLMSYLDALSCTLGTMAHTFHTGQAISRSRSNPSQVADNLAAERMGIQSLAVKQQIALTKASKLFQEYAQGRAAEHGDRPRSPALLSSKEHDVHPQSLVRYQSLPDPQLPLFDVEIEIQPRSNTISANHVDDLLQRWTNVCGKRSGSSTSTTSPTRQSPDSFSGRRLSQQATVESDTETDADLPRITSPRPRLGYAGPVLDYADADRRAAATTLPIAVPGAETRRRQHSASDVHSSWSPTAATSTSLPLRPQLHPAASPTSSQAPSLTRTVSTPSSPQQRHPPGPGSVTSTATQSSHASDPADCLGIPYRLRLHGSCWDFEDAALVHSNTSVAPAVGRGDPHTVTEIRETWIAAEALAERKLPYRMISRNVGDDDRRTRLRSFYCIERPLELDEIAELVERSAKLVEEAKVQRRERRRSSTRRTSISRSTSDLEGPRSARQSFSNFTPQWQPTEEVSNEGWEEYERSPKDRDKEWERGERRGSGSGRRRDSKGRRDSESRKTLAPERDENGKERRGSSTLRGLAAGGGIAALVTGLMDAMM